MGFLWRRRSSLLKIVCLLSAVWFTVAFLIYTEDRSDGAPNDVQLQPMALRSHLGGNGGGGDLDADAIEVVDNNDVGVEAPSKAAAGVQERRKEEPVKKDDGHENG